MTTFLLTCGEASGEHHASRLVRELKILDPSCRIVAMGGAQMQASGAEIAVQYENYAVMGFTEVLKQTGKLLSLKRSLEKNLLEKVDCFVPVDYPGLNLKLARFARKRGIPVFYFISPQIWAWGGWRVREMRRCVDLVGSILPFEIEIYRKAGIPVVFAGHPMLDEIPAPDTAKKAPHSGETFDVIIFPGSRMQEISRMLPIFIDAARIIKRNFPQASFLLGLAPSRRTSSMVEIPEDMRDSIKIVENGVAELHRASLVLAVSGTITLQTAISGTPMIVCYRTSAANYLLARLLVRIPWIAMPNILAKRKIVTELIQSQAKAEKIAFEARKLLSDPDLYSYVSSNLLSLRKVLEGRGGLRRIAEAAMLLARGESGHEIERRFSNL